MDHSGLLTSFIRVLVVLGFTLFALLWAAGKMAAHAGLGRLPKYHWIRRWLFDERDRHNGQQIPRSH